MTTLVLDYDADDDWLDIGFGHHDGLTREFALNDHIRITTDVTLSRVVRLTFTDYARLLLVSETEFDSLRDEAPDTQDDLLYLIASPPANLLLDMTDPVNLIARVCAPALHDLIHAPSGGRRPW